MTHQAAPPVGIADAGAQIAQLRQVLALVEEIAGRADAGDLALDEAARISAAYQAALPIVQRRYDSLAAETSAWAAAGVEALLALSGRGLPCRAAAGRLADELAKGLRQLSGIVGG